MDNNGAIFTGTGGMFGMEDFSLPGYRVHELLGFGSTGEVWRATELSSGEQVALKRLIAESDPLAEQSAAADDLRREAALLASVRHEHVLRLRSVRPTSTGLVLVLDYAAGGSLAALIAVRGSLSAGEVVTIGAPLAQALADVHAQGVMHGDITPGNVLFTAEGKPLLADLGVATLAGEAVEIRGLTPEFADPALTRRPETESKTVPSAAALRAADVFGLAATCLAALEVSALGSIRATIEAAMVAEPRLRPDAATFSRALFACCAPEPIRLVDGAADPPAPALTHRFDRAAVVARPAVTTTGRPRGPVSDRARRLAAGSRRRVAVAGRLALRRSALLFAAGSLVAVAVAGGVVWASRSSATPIATPSTPVTPVAAGHDDPPVTSATSAAPAASAASGMSATSATSAAGSPAPSAPTVSAAPTDWTTVLSNLDRLRDRAFEDAASADLDLVYQPQAAALASDRATLGRLVAAGEHAVGLQPRLIGVSRQSGPDPSGASPAGPVTLVVEDTLPAYSIVNSTGASVRVPGRGERRWLVVLSAAGSSAGWRIASIAAA